MDIEMEAGLAILQIIWRKNVANSNVRSRVDCSKTLGNILCNHFVLDRPKSIDLLILFALL